MMAVATSPPASEQGAADTGESYRVLSLDGGGAKGFYTLGVLKEIEAMLGGPLATQFDLIYGTSTGAIIAALLGLGRTVDEIHTLYANHVVGVMKAKSAAAKTAALSALATEVFGKATFAEMKTGVGIVTTNWVLQKPMIFKTSPSQAHGMKSTFTPGFGCTVAEAVEASCSAFPFFERKYVKTASGDRVELADGGYCANNPTLYAIADATQAVGRPNAQLLVLSVGVGVYPRPAVKPLSRGWWGKLLIGADLIDKTFEINTQSMEQLRTVLFKDVHAVRINETFSQPEMATDLFEHDLTKLNILRQRGRNSFAIHEVDLRRLFLSVEA